MCNDYTTQYARYVSLLIIIVVASPHHHYHSLLLILCRFFFCSALHCGSAAHSQHARRPVHAAIAGEAVVAQVV